MTDQIFLRTMEFEGHHGVSDEERADPQVIELDVEFELDLRPAGSSDDLAQTVSYARDLRAVPGAGRGPQLPPARGDRRGRRTRRAGP